VNCFQERDRSSQHDSSTKATESSESVMALVSMANVFSPSNCVVVDQRVNNQKKKCETGLSRMSRRMSCRMSRRMSRYMSRISRVMLGGEK
jgi:hypothetical protein